MAGVKNIENKLDIYCYGLLTLLAYLVIFLQGKLRKFLKSTEWRLI